MYGVCMCWPVEDRRTLDPLELRVTGGPELLDVDVGN